jgi:hypothetical protein
MTAAIFIAGLFVGAFAGVVAMCLAIMARDPSKKESQQ